MTLAGIITMTLSIGSAWLLLILCASKIGGKKSQRP